MARGTSFVIPCEFVGCKRDEITLVRNATEANSYIANGIDLKPGDEVLMTDQEHPGGLQPGRLRAKGYGVVVKTPTLPKPVRNASQVLNLFNDAIGDRKRVIFFSHINTVTGVALPAKELCALARSKNVLSAVDGAHVIGMMRLNLHEIGCDIYSSSTAQVAASAERIGLSVRARRSHRPDVEHHCHRRLERTEPPSRTIPADWLIERARAVGAASGHQPRQRNRH
jgi:selenocysteine lyase/cysteine desulfurase